MSILGTRSDIRVLGRPDLDDFLALAARDPRLNVVATRTELDWAIRNRQCVVWAPSKMICDTPDAPLDKAGNGIELSVWLAGLLGAAELRVHGSVSLPAGSRVPVRRG